jgi:predicted ester cyclase
MSVEENKKTLQRNFDEIWNKRNLSLIPELVSPDYVGTNVFGVSKGHDGYEQMVKNSTTTMPDLLYTVDEVVGEGDTLMAKITLTGTYTGKLGNLDISGKKIKGTTVLVNKYVDGKVKESTAYSNPLETLKQLGVTIPPEWGMG